jgi:hypothetical protein
LSRLRPNLTAIDMARSMAPHSPESPIENVYYPLRGLVSLLTVMTTGEQIETAIVGKDGVIGASFDRN